METIHDLEGKKIDEYLIRERIHFSHFSAVYLAENTSLANKKVAIKFARPGTNLARFIRDAHFLGELSSNPHIVSVFNIQPKTIEELDEADYVYFTMEYIPNSLDREIKKRGTFTIKETYKILEGVCDALEFAHNHARKVIHRDIKPHNILLGNNDFAYLCDFGLARAQDSDETRTIGLMGTPDYLSPEQARGKKLDRRTDIYSLGIVLYEMLAGEPPFHGRETRNSKIDAVKTQKPRRLDRVNNKIPFEIADVIDRCVNKRREKRFDSAAELCRAYEEAMKISQKGKLPPGIRKILLAAASVSVAVLVIFFIVLKPVDLTVKTIKPGKVSVTVDNLLWKRRIEDAASNAPIHLPKVLFGNRKFIIRADRYLPDTFVTFVSPRGSNRFTFTLQSESYHLEVLPIPEGSFVANSFKQIEATSDSFSIKQEEQDTVLLSLPAGKYSFDLIHAGYRNQTVELDVGRNKLKWRKIYNKNRSSWETIQPDKLLKLYMEPQTAYLGFELYSREKAIGNFDNFSVRLIPGPEMSETETEFLQENYFSNLDSYRNFVVPVAAKSLLLSNRGFEDKEISLSLRPGEFRNLRIDFERERKYGTVSFYADLPGGYDNVSGARVSLENARTGSGRPFQNPLSGVKTTPLSSVRFETGDYKAILSAPGWYYEKNFRVAQDKEKVIRCELDSLFSRVQILLGGTTSKALLHREDALIQEEGNDTIRLPFPGRKRFQNGKYNIKLLDAHGKIYAERQISIGRDTTITLSID